VDELPEYSTSAQPSFSGGVESEPEEGISGNFTMAKPSSTMNPRANGNKRKNKHTYSKKGKNRPQQQTFSNRRASESSDAATEIQAGGNPSLVRLGEAIIVDWNNGVYDALFGGHPGDSLRGEEARKSAETLEDVELEQKRQKRTARKKNGITLDECFTATAKGEILTEENAWYCNRCKELRQAEKTLEIWTAPDILVIHLKRFSANRQFRDKIDVLVDFPIEGLNLNDKVGMIDGKDLTYDLFAVDNHYGGLGGGHYTAFSQSFIDHKWYEYNGKSMQYSQSVTETKTVMQTPKFPSVNQVLL
jgi:ubiquitin carboxyl-terminal hydrolase 4/11/15